MNKNWFIYAKEGMYEGLHGIYEYDVLNGTYEEACSYGEEMSYGLMDSFSHVCDYYSYDDYEEEYGTEYAETHESEYYDILEDMKADYVSYEIYPLKDGVDPETIRQSNDDPATIIEEYCERDFNI